MWPRQNFSWQYQCRIKQISEENKEEISIRGLQVDPIPNSWNWNHKYLWQTRGRITNEILWVKGLSLQSTVILKGLYFPSVLLGKLLLDYSNSCPLLIVNCQFLNSCNNKKGAMLHLNLFSSESWTSRFFPQIQCMSFPYTNVYYFGIFYLQRCLF